MFSKLSQTNEFTLESTFEMPETAARIEQLVPVWDKQKTRLTIKQTKAKQLRVGIGRWICNCCVQGTQSCLLTACTCVNMSKEI